MGRLTERRYALVLAAFILTISLLVAGGLYTVINLGRLNGSEVREAQIRQGQNCELFKRFHALSLHQFNDTRRYLAALRPDERGQTINVFIAASLPRLEVQVRVDVPPRYCKSRP